eukprot:2933541-Pleurochrysis_carterae.AAC.2
MAPNGAAYRTRAAQHYRTEMNAARADSILALLPATAAVQRDASRGGIGDRRGKGWYVRHRSSIRDKSARR